MHLHYSPFQHATGVEVSDNNVNVYKVAKTIQKLTKKDTSKTMNMGSTMSCQEAAMIPGSPTAFISPNSIDSMRDIKMPLAPTGVSRGVVPKSSPAMDTSYRTRNRVGYGDRPAVMSGYSA